MIFDSGIQTWTMWLGLVIGVIAIAVVGYWFKWQDYQMHNNVSVAFNWKIYGVAGAMTIGISLTVAYISTFYGTKYIMVGTIVEESELAFIISMAIGALASFIIDACVFHPIADGTAAKAYNTAQAEIRAKIVSEETKKAIFSAIKAKSEELGLTLDASVIEKIAANAKSGDDQVIADSLELIKNAVSASSSKSTTAADTSKKA